MQVMDLGGLHVVGTERHESRRIDNQLRGRTGRQGDPGSTRFFLSLEDNIFRIFGGDKIKGLMTVRAPHPTHHSKLRSLATTFLFHSVVVCSSVLYVHR